MLRDFRERERGGGVCSQKSITGAQCVQTKSVGVVVGAFACGADLPGWCERGVGVTWGLSVRVAAITSTVLSHQQMRLARESRVFQLEGSGIVVWWEGTVSVGASGACCISIG